MIPVISLAPRCPRRRRLFTSGKMIFPHVFLNLRREGIKAEWRHQNQGQLVAMWPGRGVIRSFDLDPNSYNFEPPPRIV